MYEKLQYHEFLVARLFADWGKNQPEPTGQTFFQKNMQQYYRLVASQVGALKRAWGRTNPYTLRLKLFPTQAVDGWVCSISAHLSEAVTMKLSTYFFGSKQGKSSRQLNAQPQTRPVAIQPAPPAYRARAAAERDNSAQDEAHQQMSPHLSVIRALQNEIQPLRKSNSLFRLFEKKPAPLAPDTLRPYALYELGFTKSPKRAAKIAKGLIKVGVFDDKGSLLHRGIIADNAVRNLRDSRMSGIRKLTATEAEGVKIYLDGMSENLQMMCQDIHHAPIHLRQDWLFFINFTANKENSRFFMGLMQAHKVLDQNFLPLDGGARFDNFSHDMTKRIGQASSTWLDANLEFYSENLNHVRNTLFPLPSYEFAPAYKPHR